MRYLMSQPDGWDHLPNPRDVFALPMVTDPTPDVPLTPDARLTRAREALTRAQDQFRLRLAADRVALGAMTDDEQRGAKAAARALGGDVTRLPDGTCVVYRPGGLQAVERAHRQMEAARAVVRELEGADSERAAVVVAQGWAERGQAA